MSSAHRLVGSWEGSLSVDTTVIPMVFQFAEVLNEIKGFVDIPSQLVFKMPIEGVAVSDDSVSLTLNSIKASFEGKFSSNDLKVEGVYEQNGLKIKLDLNKGNAASSVLKRPQTPVRPFSYGEEEVKIHSGNVVLAGTLTYPLNDTPPIALVVLAHGSGGHDRDETIFEHKPFLVIADHLTKNNIAVLRYDERGIAESTGSFADASNDDLANDLNEAVKFLKRHPKMQVAAKVGVIGHSKGGNTALIAQSKTCAIDFMIFLASPALSGEETLHLQSKLILESANQSQEYIQKIRKVNADVYEIIKTNDEGVKSKVEAYADSLNQSDESFFKTLSEAVRKQIPELVKPWFKDFLLFNPRTLLSELEIPVLALWGSKDVQVAATENLSEMKLALEKADNKDHELKVLLNLNHLFQNCSTGSVAEYSQIEETFSVDALNVISHWIGKLQTAALS